MKSINPATEQLIAEYPEMDPAEVRRRVERAAEQFIAWRATPIAERAEKLHRVAGLLRERRETLARLMTTEMGKPIAAAEAEVDKCAWVCDYYAERAAAILAPRPVASDAAKSYIRHESTLPTSAAVRWRSRKCSATRGCRTGFSRPC
ncbi:MAG: aldehyde dehydrogenase family protein [Planctomycetia bacterium]|nr:aldehyde dehydrogenase family protein [Planctomycetia bacterium]